MALIMIKWTIAVMQGVMIVFALWHYIRKNSRLAPTFFRWGVIGVTVVFLPFFVYLLAMGSFTAFIQEFFINTINTINTPHGMPETYQDDLLKAWGTPERQFLLLAIFAGGWLLSRLLTSYRYIPLIVGLFFYAIAVRHSFSYYFQICNIFFIYFLIYIMSLVKSPIKILHIVIAAIAVVSWGVFDNCREGSQLKKVAKWSDGKDREEFEEALNISKAMAGYHKPKILNLFYYHFGFEVPYEGLPAGRYYAYQNGMTPEMETEHVELLKSGKADFVITGDSHESDNKGYTKEVIESYGYKQILSSDYHSEGIYWKVVSIYKNKRLE